MVDVHNAYRTAIDATITELVQPALVVILEQTVRNALTNVPNAPTRLTVEHVGVDIIMTILHVQNVQPIVRLVIRGVDAPGVSKVGSEILAIMNVPRHVATIATNMDLAPRITPIKIEMIRTGARGAGSDKGVFAIKQW